MNKGPCGSVAHHQVLLIRIVVLRSTTGPKLLWIHQSSFGFMLLPLSQSAFIVCSAQPGRKDHSFGESSRSQLEKGDGAVRLRRTDEPGSLLLHRET